MEREVNRHHAFFTRCWYRTKPERELRQHKGLIVPMWITVHDDLHANIPPPPKPNARVVAQALHYLGELPDVVTNDPVRCIGELADFLYSRSDRVAERIGENLTKQLVYIQEGFHDS